MIFNKEDLKRGRFIINSDGIRADKVSHLKWLIEKGMYNVNSLQTANKIIEDIKLYKSIHMREN